MDVKGDVLVFTIFILGIMQLSSGHFHHGNERILLDDLKVLTLNHGQMTTARRSSPVPHLKCLGGSAQGSFTPQTVQCYNKGSDGYDVQWECKTDMDNAYRFGNVEVSCEGYDYPDDPYVLKGSCGLEYTLDHTQDGYHHHHNHDYYGHNSHHHDHHGHHSHHQNYFNRRNPHNHGYSHHHGHHDSWYHGAWCGNLITLAIIAIIIYAIYRTCLCDSHVHDGHAGAGGQDQYGGSGGNPPPPGFRSDYMPDDGCRTSYGAGYGNRFGRRGNGWFGNNAGGFWGGAATGGMLGYLLGNRNTGYGYGHRPHNRGWGFGGNSWGSGGSSWGNGSSTGSSSFGSSGTRTASGYGGTKRR